MAKWIFFLCLMIGIYPIAAHGQTAAYLGVNEGETFTFKVSIDAGSSSDSFEFSFQVTDIIESSDSSIVAFQITGNAQATEFGFPDATSQYVVNETPSGPLPSQYIINKNGVNKSFSGSYGGFQATATWDERGILSSLSMTGDENSYSYSIIREGRFTDQQLIVGILLAATVAVSIYLWIKTANKGQVIGRADLKALLQDSLQQGGRINLALLGKKLGMSPKWVEIAFLELAGRGTIDGKFDGHYFILSGQTPGALDQMVDHLATWSESRQQL